MATKNKTIQLSALISEMGNIIHNNDRFCFSDFVYDIQSIISMQEKTNAFIKYWCVRKNGTYITDSINSAKDWTLGCTTVQGVYKIAYNNGLYLIENID